MGKFPAMSRRFWGASAMALTVSSLVVTLAVGAHQSFASSASAKNLPSYYQRTHDEIAQELAHSDSDRQNGGRGTGLREVGPQTAGQYQYGQRALPGAYIAPAALANAQQTADSHQYNGIGVHWQQLGPVTLNNGNYFPEPVSGRALAIAIDPRNSNVIYVGAAQGGVWKSTDGGAHWKSLTDFAPSLAINTIAIDAKNPNIIFAGTGEDNLSCDSYHGAGILRSVNGGHTWTTVGASVFQGSAIGNIILDPRYEGSAERERLIVGAGFSGSSNSQTESCQNSVPKGQLPAYGVFVSDNGGLSFTQTLSAGNLSQFPFSLGISDLKMSPSDPNTLFAAMQVEGIFKSVDGGLTWSNLDNVSTSGLPAPEAGFDRIQLAIAPSDANTAYAVYSNQVFQNAHMQAFKTTDGGATWSNLSTVPDVCDGQCWYDMPIAVSPTDPNSVFIGGNANYAYIFSLFGFQSGPADCYVGTVNLANLPADCNATVAKSTDGGKTWQDISLGTVDSGNGFPTGQYTLHPDDHAIVFDPNNPNVMYTGNDGGVFKTTDGGKTWSDLNPGLGDLQFQAISVGSNGEIFGGTQDNGTELYTQQGGTVWNNSDGGDGGLTAIDPTNANVAYHTYAGVSLEGTTNAGQVWNEIDAPLLSDGSSFYPAFAVAPSKSQTLYYGTYRVWRTDDQGGLVTDPNSFGVGHWTAISPDLTGGAANACGFGCITALAISPVNPNVVVVGTGNGLIWQSVNADSATPTWTQINATNTPNRFITQIVFAPNSANTVYVTYSGFNTNTNSTAPGHLFTSVNIGAASPTFQEIDGEQYGANNPLAIPDMPTNTALVYPRDPNVLFVAADYGVYVSIDKGHTWLRLDGNLPHSEVYDLKYDAKTNALIAATHGRGVWSLALPGLQAAPHVSASSIVH